MKEPFKVNGETFPEAIDRVLLTSLECLAREIFEEIMNDQH